MESYYWYSKIQEGIIERLDMVSTKKHPKRYVLVNGEWQRFTEETQVPYPTAIWEDFRMVARGRGIQVRELVEA